MFKCLTEGQRTSAFHPPERLALCKGALGRTLNVLSQRPNSSSGSCGCRSPSLSPSSLLLLLYPTGWELLRNLAAQRGYGSCDC